MLERVHSLAARHDMSPWRALPYEMAVRAYRRHPAVRSVVRRFLGSRRPSEWCFVTGCYNAGTTVVKNIVALHPRIHTLPVEGDLLTSALSNNEEGGWARCMYGNRDRLERERRAGAALDAERMLQDWSPWMLDGAPFLDKSISHAVRIRRLADAFPDARFVLVTRGPEAVVRGIRQRSRPSGSAREALRRDTYSDDLLHAQWNWLYRRALEELPPERGLVVSYERAMSDPIGQAVRLYSFLGLEGASPSLQGDHLVLGNDSLKLRRGGTNNASPLDSREALSRAIERHAALWPASADSRHG